MTGVPTAPLAAGHLPRTGPVSAFLLAITLSAVALLGVLPGSANKHNASCGTGITLDESFNVQQGALLVAAWKGYGPVLFFPENVREVFGGPYYLPDHPPLGRLLLGLSHRLCVGSDVTGVDVLAGRPASAVAFAACVGLLTWCAARWYGWGSGVVAGLAYLCLPRTFGHAHLAALESVMNLTFLLAVVAVAANWSAAAPVGWKGAALAGVCQGLAMLTKIQGFLFAPVVVLWALWLWRQRAWKPLLIWGVVAGLTFELGWPWLWLDPVGHTLKFLGSGTDRLSLNAFYLGQVFADQLVPWHYPWVLTLATVPLSTLLLASAGLWQQRRGSGTGLCTVGTSREWLLALAALFPLCLFSTRIAVYDGERLFLIACPPLALLAGAGYARCVAASSARRRALQGVLVIACGVQVANLVAMRDCWLSAYSPAIGGLAGANACGLERNYWGDAITPALITQAMAEAPGSARILVGPVLHQFQLADLTRAWSQHWGRRVLEPLTSASLTAAQADTSRETWILVFERLADLTPDLQAILTTCPCVAEERRQGVRLAAFYRLPPTPLPPSSTAAASEN